MEKSLLNFFFLFFLAISPIVFAASKIVNVDFVGLAKTDEASIRRRLVSLEGSVYSASAVKKDIKALYETGLFQDVAVEKEDSPGGIRLIFRVVEKGMIGSVRFLGNKKIRDKELNNAVTIREQAPADIQRIVESVEAIRKLYDEKDLYLAEVTWELKALDTEAGEMELVFNINENKGVRIRRISFVGNHAIEDKKLAKQMKTKVKGFLSFLTKSGKFDDEKLKLDADLLTYFYLNNGYIKVKIGRPQVSLTRNKKAIAVTIPVYEGNRYTVRNVDVAGDIITTREELLSKVKMAPKQIYKKMTEEEDVQALAALYGDQAYAFAGVSPSLETDESEKTVDVVYHVERGPKVTVERIDIKGNDVTRDKVIRRELQVVENAPYNKSALDLSRRRLFQLGFFEEVNFSLPRGSRDDRVILAVEVKEKPTGSFSVGAGFSSLESFIFNASIQKDNFFGRGIRGGVSANISKLRQEFSFFMTDRYFLDTRWIFSLSMHRYFSALNRDFDQKSLGGTVSFGREVFPFFDISLGYNIEDISVTNFSASVPAFFQQNASGLTSSVLTTLAYDRRDNRIQTTKGMYHSFTSEYAGHGVGGDNDFWKMYAESRVFFPLPLKSVIKARGMFGYVNSLNPDPVPLFERFFLGGINTLRGFDLNSIGPELSIPSSATGGDHRFTYGGNRMLMFNLEYELPIYAPAGIGTVMFLDAGQAWAENESIDLTAIRANYGFGLRWHSPFGPLRFEWGFPFKRREGESLAVFNFSIGQSF
ncbi:MAG: outer membrane protein assembly factor BamA [Deltaproteobacteria bacterium]|nr:outer membrane protein assembly factor BamA [Deltaproteobacteria bacterium]